MTHLPTLTPGLDLFIVEMLLQIGLTSSTASMKLQCFSVNWCISRVNFAKTSKLERCCYEASDELGEVVSFWLRSGIQAEVMMIWPNHHVAIKSYLATSTLTLSQFYRSTSSKKRAAAVSSHLLNWHQIWKLAGSSDPHSCCKRISCKREYILQKKSAAFRRLPSFRSSLFRPRHPGRFWHLDVGPMEVVKTMESQKFFLSLIQKYPKMSNAFMNSTLAHFSQGSQKPDGWVGSVVCEQKDTSHGRGFRTWGKNMVWTKKHVFCTHVVVAALFLAQQNMPIPKWTRLWQTCDDVCLAQKAFVARPCVERNHGYCYKHGFIADIIYDPKNG